MIDDPIGRAHRLAETAQRDRDNAARAAREAREAPEREARERAAAIAEGRRILGAEAARKAAEEGSSEPPAAPDVNAALRALIAGAPAASGSPTTDTPSPSDALRVLFS